MNRVRLVVLSSVLIGMLAPSSALAGGTPGKIPEVCIEMWGGSYYWDLDLVILGNGQADLSGILNSSDCDPSYYPWTTQGILWKAAKGWWFWYLELQTNEICRDDGNPIYWTIRFVARSELPSSGGIWAEFPERCCGDSCSVDIDWDFYGTLSKGPCELVCDGDGN